MVIAAPLGKITPVNYTLEMAEFYDMLNTSLNKAHKRFMYIVRKWN